jgi:hypothetical protein
LCSGRTLIIVLKEKLFVAVRKMVMARAKLTTGWKIRIGCLQILNITPHPSVYAVELEVQIFCSWLPNILSGRGDYFVARKSGLRSRLFTLHIKDIHFILKLHRPIHATHKVLRIN